MSIVDKVLSITIFKNHIILFFVGIKFSFKISKKKLSKYGLQSNKNIENIKKRIRKNKKCRVAFYIFEISKWKTGTLYEILQKDERFEPFVVLGMTPGRTKFYSEEEIEQRFKQQKQYFISKGMNVEIGYDIKRHLQIPLKVFKPDVVFYQQHVGICEENSIEKVNRYALTAYVPYNVPNYVNVSYDYNEFCSKLYRFYTLNESLKEYYIKILDDSLENIVATGHTTLDYFYLNKNKKTENKYVIYAPHFSIMHPKIKNKFYYSTFTRDGELILDFARNHQEINWVFKPHPNLKESLKKMNVPNENIEAYYEEWAKIGAINEDSDYLELFANSKALVTDCGSFLTEYFCTGKPLLHLIQPNAINWPSKILKPMFNSFYKIYNTQDLLQILERVVVQNDDYKKTERQIIQQSFSFTDEYAAKNILEDLLKLF